MLIVNVILYTCYSETPIQIKGEMTLHPQKITKTPSD